jgi:DNA-binding IclR family transcriptional regulator
MTDNTITDRRVLFEEVERIRATGVAFDHEEHTIGIAAAAVTVRDSAGTVAAISVIIPAARSHGSWGQVTAALLRTRDQVQAAFHCG